MPWAHVTDHWDEHHKFLAAFEREPRSICLYFAGLSYCKRSGNDGLIPGGKVRSLLGWSLRAQRALVQYDLWCEAGAGAMEVHDYLDWNYSAQERSAKARNAAQIMWARRRSNANA